jgi:hypothetical protein
MKKRLFVSRLITIALILLIVFKPVFAKSDESKGKQKGQYTVTFKEAIDGSGTATVINRWSLGISGPEKIFLNFVGSIWDPFDIEHEIDTLSIQTHDKGETVLIGMWFNAFGDKHYYVLRATGDVKGEWMGDTFDIVFSDAAIVYKKSQAWSEPLDFTITCSKVP